MAIALEFVNNVDKPKIARENILSLEKIVEDINNDKRIEAI